MRYRTHLLDVLAAAALGAGLLLSAPSQAQIGIAVSVNLAPPPLPIYAQPPLPAVGYLWVPGYWAWADGDYYWVPGTWVAPPQPDLLWTPGYWGWSDGSYLWHEGYWGPQVGFYGGVNYGFGYGGIGYAGGYWSHGAFFYNRTVNRIPAGVRGAHVFSRPVPAHVSHVSFNGGSGGTQARPSPAQLAAQRRPHLSPVAAQRQQEQLAAHSPALHAASNHGRPPITATARPGQFSARAHSPPQGSAHNAHAANVHPQQPQPQRLDSRPRSGNPLTAAPYAAPATPATHEARPQIRTPARAETGPGPAPHPQPREEHRATPSADQHRPPDHQP